ncbi:MAG: Mitochondrial import inner membrane translocase subunit tim22 [Trizodia sp. TS-e1964]|nr:MAG: Mitochondrial import inner membrane translocase subunit tim22 [Trizodia sp. TS-e1964]
MNVPGLPPGRPTGSDALSPEQAQEQWIIKTMQSAMESCPAKTALSGGMGFVLGGAIGLFMSSMAYDTPMSASGQEMAKLAVREQLRRGFRDMGARSLSSAKNFGVIGAIFSGSECVIEGVSIDILALVVGAGLGLMYWG